MKLRQLVYLTEVVKQGFNISAAAHALSTAQPGVSRQLQALAGELGVELFRHQGKRLVGLTEPGKEIAALAAAVLRGIVGIREVAEVHGAGHESGLIVVTTRHAASHQLRTAMVRLHEEMPTLDVRVYEEEPASAATMLRTSAANLGILSESAERYPDLLYFPIEQWRLVLVAPRGHALCGLATVTLEALARYPLCSFERSAISRQIVDEAFREAGWKSLVAYSLGSSTLILKYVESGVGVGILGEAAFDPTRNPNLRGIDIGHLFRPLTTDVVLPRTARVPNVVYGFARILAPSLTRETIEDARNAPPV
jgi:LysR family transcriptional regulator, cys regulon transcriptional activator